MKQILLSGLFLIFVHFVFGQQLPVFSQYREHHVLINPAFAPNEYITPNYDYSHTVGISLRRQWEGLLDGPKTYTLSYQGVLRHLAPEPIFGATLLLDKTGPTGIKGGYLRGGLGVELGYEGATILYAALSVGFVNYYFKPTEEYLNSNFDPNIFFENRWYMDLSPGVFFRSEVGEHRVYGGVSVMQLVAAPLGRSNEEDPTTFERQAHFYANAGAYFTVADYAMIEPSFWLKYTQDAPLNGDFAFRVILINRIWLGVNGSIDLTGGTRVNHMGFEVGFAFNYGDRDKKYIARIGSNPFNFVDNVGSAYDGSYEVNGSFSWGSTKDW